VFLSNVVGRRFGQLETGVHALAGIHEHQGMLDGFALLDIVALE